MKYPEGVVLHDVAALEVGLCVYSKTHTRPSGAPVGGTIIDLFEDSVVVVTDAHPKQGPETREVAHDDIDWEVTNWGTRNAGIVADNLFLWVGSLTSKLDRQRANADDWTQMAVRLRGIRDNGPWPPRALQRERDARQTKGWAS